MAVIRKTKLPRVTSVIIKHKIKTIVSKNLSVPTGSRHHNGEKGWRSDNYSRARVGYEMIDNQRGA